MCINGSCVDHLYFVSAALYILTICIVCAALLSVEDWIFTSMIVFVVVFFIECEYNVSLP